MKEDFVTYEIAVKLKEKGFREHVRGHYKSKYHLSVCLEPINCNGSTSVDISAPQIHEVLKWLREEKDIFIGLEYINQERYGCTIIVQKTGGLIAKWNWDKFQYANKNPLVGDTYEKAAITGIKYVVDNLI